MEEVPRRTPLAPLASPCFVLCLIRVETKGVWQKSDEKSDRSIRKSDQKVTERVPKTRKKVIELLMPTSLCATLKRGGAKRTSGKRKAHKHKLFGPVALGTTPGLSQGQTQFVPGTNPVCPWDKPGLSLGQTEVFSLLYTVDAQFVPGTNLACSWDKPVANGGRKSLCAKCLCAFSGP